MSTERKLPIMRQAMKIRGSDSRRKFLFGFITTLRSFLLLPTMLMQRASGSPWNLLFYVGLAMWMGFAALELAYATGVWKDKRESVPQARGAVAAHALGLLALLLISRRVLRPNRILPPVILVCAVLMIAPHAYAWFKEFRSGFHDPPTA